MNNPTVTAICATYGRHKHLTEETIESFLRQDYPHKQLLILNTHLDPIELNIPSIRVMNVEDNFSTFFQKMLYLVKQVDTDYWCNMDDDDIFLPWHISQLMKQIERMTGNVRVQHENVIFTEKNVIKSVAQWTMWSCCLFKRLSKKLTHIMEALAQDTSKFYSFDWELMTWRGWKCHNLYYPNLPSYVYRWDTGSRHLSGYGENQQQGYDDCRAEANAIENKTPWQPHWDHDYVQLVYDFIRNNPDKMQYNGVKLEIPEMLKSAS